MNFKTVKLTLLNALQSSFANRPLGVLTSEPRAQLLCNAENDGSRLTVLKFIVKPPSSKILGAKRDKKSGV